MRDRLFDLHGIIEGEYYPGTFLIGISKKFFNGMKYSDFTKEEMATFVHEYIHFLQDISTVAGCMNYNYNAKLFQLHFSLFQKNEEGHLPVDLETCGVENAFAQTELLSLYEGGSIFKSIHHVDKVICEKEELITEILQKESSYSGDDIPQISLYFNDRDDPTIFGSFYIKESMAYLIERYLFGAEERKNELPYNACEMICEKIYPDLLGTPEIIVALCELSLMHYHSGLEFYLLVNHMAREEMLFSGIDEFFEYFQATADLFVKQFEKLYTSIHNVVDVMYPVTFPYLSVSNDYVKVLFKAGLSMRQCEHFFISSLFKKENPVEIIISWVDLFPLPMFLDDINHELYGAADMLSMMPVPIAILKFFRMPSDGCPLLEYCKYSHIDAVDEKICTCMPWEQ